MGPGGIIASKAEEEELDQILRGPADADKDESKAHER